MPRKALADRQPTTLALLRVSGAIGGLHIALHVSLHLQFAHLDAGV